MTIGHNFLNINKYLHLHLQIYIYMYRIILVYTLYFSVEVGINLERFCRC